MLGYLAKHASLPLPHVYFSGPTLLLMDFIADDGELHGSEEEHLAELIASLHQVTADNFGLERDTVIGPLHQPNPWTARWADFFGEHRLMHMAQAAHREGHMHAALLQNIERLVDKLPNLLPERSTPSLIHGDLWQGNILTCHGRIHGLIDPAIYYADAEIELAFMTMFNTVSDDFFKRYHELRPMEPGFFKIRRELYLLYPLLVHLRIYGSSYLEQVERIVRKFV